MKNRADFVGFEDSDADSDEKIKADIIIVLIL